VRFCLGFASDLLDDHVEVTGKKVVYKQISDEEFMAATKAPPRIALEFLEMMKYFEEFGCMGLQCVVFKMLIFCSRFR
jgi:hypothetical protein